MPRPMVLVFLLVLLIVTSQFEWKQPLMNEMDPLPRGLSVRQQSVLKEEVVKEKIILSQERTIHKLNELVQSLQQQLLQCQSISISNNNTINATGGGPLTANISDLEGHQILED